MLSAVRKIGESAKQKYRSTFLILKKVPNTNEQSSSTNTTPFSKNAENIYQIYINIFVENLLLVFLEKI